MDRIDPARRSANMSRIRAKNTKPELIVRRATHALGFRFRLHRCDLPGSPDLVFPSKKAVIFVHGCFWHQHPSSACRDARPPKSRLDYWLPKLRRNVERDADAVLALRREGWRVLTIWDCETSDQGALKRMLSDFLTGGPRSCSSSLGR